jgi:hypothetical protein
VSEIIDENREDVGRVTGRIEQSRGNKGGRR